MGFLFLKEVSTTRGLRTGLTNVFNCKTLGGIEAQKPPASSASSVTVTPPGYGATSSRSAPPALSDPTTALEQDEVPKDEPKRMTAMEIVKDVYIRRVLTAYIFLAVLTSSIDALWVLWLYMPISKSGVGFSVGCFTMYTWSMLTNLRRLRRLALSYQRRAFWQPSPISFSSRRFNADLVLLHYTAQ